MPKLTVARMIMIALAALPIIKVRPAIAQTTIEEFFDHEYEYSFQYPASWAIRKLPEGEANKEMRAALQGPNGSSFVVIVEKANKRTVKEEFYANSQQKETVEAMMAQTIEQIYKVISRNVKATTMTVGERRDLSNEAAIKFYISTLHTLPNGKSIIVAGIHAFPFSKDYGVNFLMTAFADKTATPEIGALTLVFNSFHLTGEAGTMEAQPGPAAKAPEGMAPKP